MNLIMHKMDPQEVSRVDKKSKEEIKKWFTEKIRNYPTQELEEVLNPAHRKIYTQKGMANKVEYAHRILDHAKTENILVYVKNNLLFVLDVDNIYIGGDCLYSNEKTIKVYPNKASLPREAETE